MEDGIRTEGPETPDLSYTLDMPNEKKKPRVTYPGVKGPAFSLAAQGTLGDIYYSHHNGNTYAYSQPQRQEIIPSERQKEIRAKFVKAQDYWQGFEPRIHFIFQYLADNKPIYTHKDCKRALPEPRTMWTRIAMWEMPDEIFWAGIAPASAWLIAKFIWVLLIA